MERNSYHSIGGHIRSRNALRLLNRLLADNLNPVLIGVQHERDMPHLAVRQLLLERVPGVLEALARRLDVVDADARVPEPAVRLRVAVVDLVLRVVLGAVVVRQLDDALAVERAAAGGPRVGRVVGQKVEVELGLGLLDLLDDLHAEGLVELDCEAGVSIGVLEDEWVCLMRTRSLGVLHSDH